MSVDQRNDFQDYSLTAALTMSFMAALRFAVAGAESKTNEAIRKKWRFNPQSPQKFRLLTRSSSFQLQTIDD
jgi:hypothetical protein